MANEIDIQTGRVVPVTGHIEGSPQTHEKNPMRAPNPDGSLVRNDESVASPGSSVGGAAQPGSSTQLEGKHARMVGGEVVVETSDPRATAPFEAGQTLNVQHGTMPGTEDGNPAL